MIQCWERKGGVNSLNSFCELVFLNIMESILVHPKNAEELKELKTFLETADIQFEAQEDILPLHVVESINRGLKQAENGETISLKEFTDKYFAKK